MFTYNERERTDYRRFSAVLGAVSGLRLTYAEVTGQDRRGRLDWSGNRKPPNGEGTLFDKHRFATHGLNPNRSSYAHSHSSAHGPLGLST